MEKTVEKRLTRSEVPGDLTWKLDDLFVSDQAWEAELAVIENDTAKIERFKDTLHISSKELSACLMAHEHLLMKMVKAATYASLKQYADGTNPVNQANSAKLAALRTKMTAALSFIHSEILSLEEGTIEKNLQENSELQPFRKDLLELLETKKHRLSPETEEVLSALGEVHGAPYTIYNMAKLADMDFAPITDSEGHELPVSFAL
jgi:oligoendopeptidase F